MTETVSYIQGIVGNISYCCNCFEVNIDCHYFTTASMNLVHYIVTDIVVSFIMKCRKVSYIKEV